VPLDFKALELADAIQIAIAVVLSAQVVFLYLTFRHARKAAETTERYEELRMMPLLKAEWLLLPGTFTIAWRIRNVGLGPAILDYVELYVNQKQTGAYPASVENWALEAWRDALRAGFHADYPGDEAVHPAAIHELKRALGPNEWQETMYIDFKRGDLAVNGLAIADAVVSPIIHFQSLSGKRLSTAAQYRGLGTDLPITDEETNPDPSPGN